MKTRILCTAVVLVATLGWPSHHALGSQSSEREPACSYARDQRERLKSASPSFDEILHEAKRRIGRVYCPNSSTIITVLSAAGGVRVIYWDTLEDLQKAHRAVDKARSRLAVHQRLLAGIKEFGAQPGATHQRDLEEAELEAAKAEQLVAQARSRVWAVEYFAVRDGLGVLTSEGIAFFPGEVKSLRISKKRYGTIEI